MSHKLTQYDKNTNTYKRQGFNKNEHSEMNKYKT